MRRILIVVSVLAVAVAGYQVVNKIIGNGNVAHQNKIIGNG